MGVNFASLRKLTGDSVELISISVDPDVDTPERLRTWAARFKVGPPWTLVTGKKAVIDQLLTGLKAFAPDRLDHATTVLIGSGGTGAGWIRANALAPAATLAELVAVAQSEARAANPQSPAHKFLHRCHARRSGRRPTTPVHRPAERQGRDHRRALHGMRGRVPGHGAHVRAPPGLSWRPARQGRSHAVDLGRPSNRHTSKNEGLRDGRERQARMVLPLRLARKRRRGAAEARHVPSNGRKIAPTSSSSATIARGSGRRPSAWRHTKISSRYSSPSSNDRG